MKGGGAKYKQFFKGALEKFGVDEPDKLSDEDKRDFFNYVDKNWTGDKESD